MPRIRSNSRENTNSTKVPLSIPTPAPTIQNRTTSIANVIMEGFAWGTGTSIARRIFSPEEKKVETKIEKKVETNDNTIDLWAKYDECVNKCDDGARKCDYLLNLIKSSSR
jgi:hypothetical protein